MKIVIIGGVAGGATTAARLRRLDEKAEIIMIDKGNHISFANCGLPYYIGDVIKDKDELLLQTPESFKQRFNIDVRIRQKVLKINKEEKKILVEKKDGKEQYEETYDKLIISTGAEPVNHVDFLEGNERVKTLRTIEDAQAIKQHIKSGNVKDVVIVGGGYIGVEMAENLRNYPELNITIVQSNDHLIGPLDKDMACFVHRELRKNGINIILNNGLAEIEQDGDKLNVILDNGELKADFVILSIGVKPEGVIGLVSGLTVRYNGAIDVNEYLQTKNKDIYAIGDVIITENTVTGNSNYTPLAGPANRQARIVANNIAGKIDSYEGSIGSSIIKIFDYSLAMTGLNEKMCKEKNLSASSIIISPNSHASYYPGAKPILIKCWYNKIKGQIYGAQVWGKEGVDKICDILAVAVKMKMTAYDLEKLELCYAPPYSSAKSPINILGNSIVNNIERLVRTVTWQEVEDLKKREKYLILDVRTDEEYERGSVENAIHIPLDDLRKRLNELDKTKKYLIYCRTGLRSYLACRILMQNGFDVYNITGGYSFYKVISEN